MMPRSNLSPFYTFLLRILLFSPSPSPRWTPRLNQLPVSSIPPRNKSRDNRFTRFDTMLDPLTSVYCFPIRSCNTAAGPLPLPRRETTFDIRHEVGIKLTETQPLPSRAPRRYTVSAASGLVSESERVFEDYLIYGLSLARSRQFLNEIPPVHIPARLRHDLLPSPPLNSSPGDCA